jgi:hypothetical protein
MGESRCRKVFSAGLEALLLLLLYGPIRARGEENVVASSSAQVGPRTAAERFGLPPAAQFAILRARRALENPVCREIFRDFQGSSGRTLQEQLDSLGWSGQRYLDSMVFYQFADPRSCRNPRILAATAPGDRVVFICGSRFSNLIRRDPSALWVAILHEELHSLGLGENPPTSEEISRGVAQRCR